MDNYGSGQEPQGQNTTGYAGTYGQQPDMAAQNGQPYAQPDAMPQSDMTGATEQPSGLSLRQEPQGQNTTGYAGTYSQPYAQNTTGYAGAYGQQPGQNTTGYAGTYGQPYAQNTTGYADPYGMPDYGQPVDLTGTVSPKKPKKPLTKGKIAALIGGGVAVVAAVVCGVIFLPGLFKSDKEVVLDAVEETFDSYELESMLTDRIGWDELQQTYLEKGGESDGAYTITLGEGDGSASLSCEIQSVKDQKNKEISSDVKVSCGDTELIRADLYADEDSTYVSVPDIIDGYLMLPNQDVLGQLANSVVGESMGLDSSSLPGYEYNLDYFTAGESGSSSLSSEYVDALETLWDAATFEKQGRAKITVNDETLTAKEYYVTWAKEDLQDACVSALDGLTAAVTESEDALAESGMSAEDYEYYMEQIKAMVPSLITKDLQVKVYVKGGKAVKIICADEISLMGMVSIDYNFTLETGEDDLSGEMSFGAAGSEAGMRYEAHDVKGDMYGTVSVFYGDTEIGADFSRSVTTEGSDETTTFTLSATDYLSYNSVMTLHEDNTFDSEISLDIVGADTYTLTMAGALTDVRKGEAFTLSVDQFEIKAVNQTICTGSYMTKMDTANTSVTPKDESLPVYDIVNMTDNEWAGLTQDNMVKLQDFADRIENSADLQAFTDLINDLAGSY